MRLALSAIVFATVLVSCGGAEPAPPPKLNVIPKGEVTSTMWTLASHIGDLDALMRSTPPERLEQRDVVLVLEQIERAAKRLTTDESRRVHPLLADNADTFASAATRAREAAEHTPPNYYFAGALTAACIYCHDPEGGIW